MSARSGEPRGRWSPGAAIKPGDAVRRGEASAWRGRVPHTRGLLVAAALILVGLLALLASQLGHEHAGAHVPSALAAKGRHAPGAARAANRGASGRAGHPYVLHAHLGASHLAERPRRPAVGKHANSRPLLVSPTPRHGRAHPRRSHGSAPQGRSEPTRRAASSPHPRPSPRAVRGRERARERELRRTGGAPAPAPAAKSPSITAAPSRPAPARTRERASARRGGAPPAR